LKEKILILGSTGLIGHQVYNYFKDIDKYELHNTSYKNKARADTILLDARNENNFIETIKNISPHYIINCSGILINRSESNPENAIYLNSYIPNRLARLADKINSKFIQLSTDCVFSGRKKKPYLESDLVDGESTYAKTKGLGEINNNRHLTLRTSVVGPTLQRNEELALFDWFMNQSNSINGYTKTIWSGVTTIELAKAIHWAIEDNITGLYHITNGVPISKYELLELFKKYTNKQILIRPIEGEDSDKSFIDTRLLLNYKVPSYEQMIIDMINLIRNDRLLYSHYEIDA